MGSRVGISHVGWSHPDSSADQSGSVPAAAAPIQAFLAGVRAVGGVFVVSGAGLG